MTWTGQNFSVGQVLTAAQMTNLQADITAVANGDAGAPSIEPTAFHAAVTGTNLTFTTPISGSQEGTTLAKVKEVQVPYGGTFSVLFTLSGDGTTETIEGRIYVNGSAVGTNRSQAASTTTEYTEDIAVVAGDLIQIYARCSTSIFITATISGLKFKEGGSSYYFGEIL